MSSYNVVIDLEGAQRFACDVEHADDPRQAIDRAWGLWQHEVAHPGRILREARGELTVMATPVP